MQQSGRIGLLCVVAMVALAVYLGYVYVVQLPTCIEYFEGVSLKLPLSMQFAILFGKLLRNPVLTAGLCVIALGLTGFLASRKNVVATSVCVLLVVLFGALARLPDVAIHNVMEQFAGNLEEPVKGPSPGLSDVYSAVQAMREIQFVVTGPTEKDGWLNFDYTLHNAGAEVQLLSPLRFGGGGLEFKKQTADSPSQLEAGKDLKGSFQAKYHSSLTVGVPVIFRCMVSLSRIRGGPGVVSFFTAPPMTIKPAPPSGV